MSVSKLTKLNVFPFFKKDIVHQSTQSHWFNYLGEHKKPKSPNKSLNPKILSSEKMATKDMNISREWKVKYYQHHGTWA